MLYKDQVTEKAETAIPNQNTYLVIIPGGMTSSYTFLMWQLLNHLQGDYVTCHQERLLFGNCPLPPARNIRPSDAPFGMTFHQTPLSQFGKQCILKDINGTYDHVLWKEALEGNSSSND